jgi:hypothetical protein
MEIIGHIENFGDTNGTGRVFRACVAIGRSCGDEKVREEIIQIGTHYVKTKSKEVLSILEQAVKKLKNIDNYHLKQALQAMEIALEGAPIKSTLKDRESMWRRFNRLVKS